MRRMIHNTTAIVACLSLLVPPMAQAQGAPAEGEQPPVPPAQEQPAETQAEPAAEAAPDAAEAPVAMASAAGPAAMRAGWRPLRSAGLYIPGGRTPPKPLSRNLPPKQPNLR